MAWQGHARGADNCAGCAAAEAAIATDTAGNEGTGGEAMAAVFERTPDYWDGAGSPEGRPGRFGPRLDGYASQSGQFGTAIPVAVRRQLRDRLVAAWRRGRLLAVLDAESLRSADDGGREQMRRVHGNRGVHLPLQGAVEIQHHDLAHVGLQSPHGTILGLEMLPEVVERADVDAVDFRDRSAGHEYVRGVAARLQPTDHEPGLRNEVRVEPSGGARVAVVVEHCVDVVDGHLHH
eukprot:CAMPEP_0170403172 /NCGR_PEP_ID=MMETSP0117_2-20130122/25955_1 /TAXON_ID=400756 /ORGANISM="Durinskia baltica, Strain CSIRO CS-38" /LENGTH=234 /DNA_ID=CAMNT_0010660101 /DNA_START=68 /DNA_END=768 /DNA_ORIENTATION=+